MLRISSAFEGPTEWGRDDSLEALVPSRAEIRDFKVHIFREGHKILRNLRLTFDYSTYSQKLGEAFAKFCGLLRIYKLYNISQGLKGDRGLFQL